MSDTSNTGQEHEDMIEHYFQEYAYSNALGKEVVSKGSFFTAMRQYAAQQVQEVDDVANWHVRKFNMQNALRQEAERQLSEVTRQRDEAVRLLSLERERNNISTETGCALTKLNYQISQLENEKKDGE